MICDKVLVPKIGGKKNYFLEGFGMNELALEEKVNIKDKIYEINGKYVMLDSDLAQVYHCKNGTKEVNQAVKNNIDKFPERYSWVLSDGESNDLLVKIFDQKIEKRGGRYKNPRVFTEEGCLMLGTILKSDIAINTTILIVEAFVIMKKYISNSLLEQRYINNKVFELDERVSLLETAFTNKTFSNEIFYDGELYDAYSLLLKIINTSKKSIIVIDTYVSKELLDVLSKTNKDITIYSKNLDNNLINKYNSQYSNVIFRTDNRFHDRFIIIDESDVYHCGASFKDLGKKCFAINKIKDEKMIKELLSRL